MDQVARHHYDLRFKCDFLEKKGNAFQDFFSELMQKVHPADFIPTKPWGKVGDKKNDGYLKSARTLFQVYAPDEMTASKAISKIGADFDGALPYWKTHFDRWVFVHNSKGLGPDALKKLLEIGKKHPKIKIESWGFEELRREFWKLPEHEIVGWFGAGPTAEALLKLGYEDLRVVLEAIAKQTPPLNDPIKPVDPGKLAANALSTDAESLLAAGMRKAKLVEKFFAEWHDPTFGDVVTEAFGNEYRRLKSLKLSPDDIFVHLQDFAGGKLRGNSTHQTAVLAVLAHLFEECDIFEPPRKKTET
ncbi:MAG: ABC-three component system protein [Verrucomicrobiota bacterium]|jgi:hypothetical protein